MSRKEGRDWELIHHAPKWVAAPIRVDAEGNEEPGFLCIHELESDGDLCAAKTFDELDLDQHSCAVKLRRWNISRPCYDKYHRCPGWAGGGMKFAKTKFCRNGGSLTRVINYDDPWWRWKTHRCPECSVLILPYMIRYTSPREWWWEIRLIRSRGWFYGIETWIGKRFGRW